MDAPDVEDEEGQRWDPSTLTALVVGCGPTGALAAHYLAMRGYRVQVYDKGPRPRPGDAASVPLVLSSRGAIAFEELRLDQQRRVGPTATALRGVWDMVGRRLQPLDTTSMYRRAYVTDRSGLALDLVEAAEQQYPDTVRFHFDTELARAELKNRVAVLRPATSRKSAAVGSDGTSTGGPSTPSSATAQGRAGAGPAPAAAASGAEADGDGCHEQQEVPYDLLVGADGVESTVRRILKTKVKDFGVIRPVEEEGAAYKAVSGLPRPASEPLVGFYTHRPQEYLYEWRNPGRPGPCLRLFCDLDGSLRGTVAGLTQWVGAAEAEAELRAAFPDLPAEWTRAVAEQATSPSSSAPRQPAILQCSQFYGPRTVLLGDSAHAVTGASGPMGQGQGPSAAVESVRTLALVLRGAQDDLDKVPEVYSNVRGDAVMAMQMLEFMALTRGDEPRKLKFASFWYDCAARVTQAFRALSEFIGKVLSTLMPQSFLTAGQVTSRLEDRRIGYSEVLKMLQGYCSPVVAVVLGGIFVGLLVAFNRVLS